MFIFWNLLASGYLIVSGYFFEANKNPDIFLYVYTFIYFTASDKPNLGLEELQNINVRSKFKVFEYDSKTKNEISEECQDLDFLHSKSFIYIKCYSVVYQYNIKYNIF